MSYLDKIRACNRWDPADFAPLLFAGRQIGRVRRSNLALLERWPGQFRRAAEALHWTPAADDFAGRTAELDAVVRQLIADGVISHHHGEPYPVTAGQRDQACCLVDRASTPFFGVRAFGQHLNGFVRTAQGIELWIGRRAADRMLYPRHLDHLVAGGLPDGLSLAENLRKECAEEAGMDPALAARAVPVSLVTYCRDSDRGLKPDVIYCYDLEVPEDFQPRCTDGEVEAFYRLPVAEVARLVRETDDFKLNCNLVIIDFLVRHGLITPDEPDYLDILMGLRAPLG